MFQMRLLCVTETGPANPVEEPPEGCTKFPSVDGYGPHDIVESKVQLDAEDLEHIDAGTDERTGDPIITFQFSGDAAKRLHRTTLQNIGRQLAIVIDGKIVSAPVILEPIAGGRGQISGGMTNTEVKDLVRRIRGSIKRTRDAKQ